MRTPLAIVALTAALAAQDVPPPTGTYRAWIDSPGGDLPFGLQLAAAGDDLEATVVNGPEELRYSATWNGSELRIPLAPYESHILARVVDGALEGTWHKRLGAERWQEMTFHARRGPAPRFPIAHESDPTPLAPRWAVQFERDDDPSVGRFTVDDRGHATGTFATTLGDYRFLAGSCRGGLLELSCFDGAHAFLFRAQLQDDGSLRGDFWSSAKWHETWTARPDKDAALPDAYQLSEWRGENGTGDLAFPDLDGKVRRLDDPAFAGKARLLVVFGSWCPNCNDETAYLRELEEQYRGRGLSILGIAFERTGDSEIDRAQVRRYAAHHGIEFPILIAGLLDKAKASQAFPLLDRVRAYPTTIFLHGDGRLHSVHTGFSGPALEEEHRALRQTFERTIEELLSEG